MRFYLVRDIVPSHLLEAFHLRDDGLCSLCHAHAEGFDAASLRQEISALVPGTKVVLGLSGGKDSLSTLYLAHQVLGLEVHAVMLDNGFIPAPVIAQARSVCERLEVPLEVARLGPEALVEFAGIVDGSDVGRAPPCATCSKSISRALRSAAARTEAAAILSGTNFFALWTDRPHATLEERLGGQRRVLFVNLPFALGITRSDALENVARLGARPKALPGVSTNCRVPGLVQDRVTDGLGHVPELEMLSLEVMSGYSRREDALAELQKKRAN
jgi:PP-loop superfamily ATP-utilizing enzyme